MALIVKSGGEFQNHPEGQARAVCVDVVDLGMVENKKFGKMQHKIALVFHSEETMDDGRPFEMWERFTATLDDRGKLRPFLQSWRGKAFTEGELEGFDVERLIGVNALIQVIHNKVGDKTYANIGTIMKLPKGTALLPVTDGYERRKDRKPEMSKTPEPAMAGSVRAGRPFDDDPGPGDPPYDVEAEDSDLPF